MDQGEFAYATKPTVRLAEEGDDDLLAFLPLVQTVRPGVPDAHCAGAVLSFGDGAMEGQVLHRMIFGPYREVVDPRVGRRRLGHSPAGENALVLQSDVVVQPACMVFLDDESEAVLTPIRRRGRHWLRRLRRIAHAAVRGKRIPAGARSQRCQWVTKISEPGDHFGILELPQIRILQLLPGTRRSNHGPVASTQ